MKLGGGRRLGTIGSKTGTNVRGNHKHAPALWTRTTLSQFSGNNGGGAFP